MGGRNADAQPHAAASKKLLAGSVLGHQRLAIDVLAFGRRRLAEIIAGGRVTIED